MKVAFCLVLAFALGVSPILAQDGFEMGRILPEDRDDVFGVAVGMALDVESAVYNTSAGVASDSMQVAGPGMMLGLSHEYWAWMFSVRTELSFATVSEDKNAETDIYIKTGDKIMFNGAAYEYMMIPAGSGFKHDIFGVWLEMNAMFHPFSYTTPYWSFTPFLEGGFLAMVGDSAIDAGAPSSTSGGFVVGGDSSSIVTMFTPQYGLGFEWRSGAETEVNHIVRCHYLMATMGDDLDHLNIKFSYRMLFPLADYENTLFTGIDIRHTSTETLDDQEQSEFGMSSAALLFGLTY